MSGRDVAGASRIDFDAGDDVVLDADGDPEIPVAVRALDVAVAGVVAVRRPAAGDRGTALPLQRVPEAIMVEVA